MNGSVNANRWREEFGLSKLPLESGSVWIARECVPFSIPSFFWWEWNVKWQILRQSSVCVSKVRLIQDEFWACQAQLYQPLLTLTELKKENIKRKDWHDEIISYESMQFINFFILKKFIQTVNKKDDENIGEWMYLLASMIFGLFLFTKLHDYKSHLNMTQLVLHKVLPHFFPLMTYFFLMDVLSEEWHTAC